MSIANRNSNFILDYECDCKFDCNFNFFFFDRKLEFELYLSIANRFHFFLICSLMRWLWLLFGRVEMTLRRYINFES
jgi:hypothetical protein